MSRKHVQGYSIRPSEGSRRGQKWGSASGHPIQNEGEVTYKFLTEEGAVAQGTTQIGDVRKPLAAVSKITKNDRIVFFSQGEDWIIDKRDEVASQILKLVRQAKKKTKLYEHRGTYRMRAWMLPGDLDKKSQPATFRRQGR